MSIRRGSSAGWSAPFADSSDAVFRERPAATASNTKWTPALTARGLHERWRLGGTGFNKRGILEDKAMDLDPWKPHAGAMEAYQRAVRLTERASAPATPQLAR